MGKSNKLYINFQILANTIYRGNIKQMLYKQITV